MYYSSFGLLAIVLHLILNFDVLKNGRKEPRQGPHFRYRQFLNALFIFYVADMLWGFSVDSGIRFFAYADTLMFFLSMAFSVFLWTRYVVAFLGSKGPRTFAFMTAGWGIFGFVVLNLIINFFVPVIFTFTDDTEYVPGSIRHLLLIVQFLLFILISVYSLFVSWKSKGRQRSHYLAVGVSGGVMAVFIVIQMLFPFAPFYTIGCLIGNCLIHVFVEEDEKEEQFRITAEARKDKERYSQISASLATDYDIIYYINIETGKYLDVSDGELHDRINVSLSGEDFYSESRKNALKYAHPDDREFAESMYYKETMQKNLEGHRSYSYQYRLMVDDEARYFRFVVILSEDGAHFVLCGKDIQDTITAETALREKQKRSITFSRIAESLASNYDVIYYVDMRSGDYIGYTSNNIYGELKVDESGSDFFSDAKRNASSIIHPDDRERLYTVLDKDYLLTVFGERKQFDCQYRLIINGRIQHTRLSARRSSDSNHFIIVVENIDNEISREKEHLRALNTEKELARRDELTGTRNKTAFTEFGQSIQNNIDNGLYSTPFAIAVCDLNDLKKINDTKGHKAGDEYIKSAAALLCDIFGHSPVFRIGGDEFAIFLSGKDFNSRSQLLGRLRESSLTNRDRNEGPVVAAGLAEYDPSCDSNVTEIFERADRMMYEDKHRLKSRV